MAILHVVEWEDQWENSAFAFDNAHVMTASVQYQLIKHPMLIKTIDHNKENVTPLLGFITLIINTILMHTFQVQ